MPRSRTKPPRELPEAFTAQTVRTSEAGRELVSRRKKVERRSVTVRVPQELVDLAREYDWSMTEVLVSALEAKAAALKASGQP